MVRMQKTIERYYKYAKGGHTNNTDVEQYMQVDLYLGIKEYILWYYWGKDSRNEEDNTAHICFHMVFYSSFSSKKKKRFFKNK